MANHYSSDFGTIPCALANMGTTSPLLKLAPVIRSINFREVINTSNHVWTIESFLCNLITDQIQRICQRYNIRVRMFTFKTNLHKILTRVDPSQKKCMSEKCIAHVISL